MFTYTPHRADCSPVNDVRITVLTPPAHGSVTTRPDTVIAGASRFGAADCSGRPVAGMGVYYLPQPGFHGADRFDYDASFSNGTEHATVTSPSADASVGQGVAEDEGGQSVGRTSAAAGLGLLSVGVVVLGRLRRHN